MKTNFLTKVSILLEKHSCKYLKQKYILQNQILEKFNKQQNGAEKYPHQKTNDNIKHADYRKLLLSVKQICWKKKQKKNWPADAWLD